MAIWARVDNSKCVEFIGFEPTGKFHPDIEWVEVPTALEAYVNRVSLLVAEGVVEPADMEAVKTVRLADIKATCDAALAPLDAAYPGREVASWPQQIAEATLVAADPSLADPPPAPLPDGYVDTIPLLRTMAAERTSLSPAGTAKDRIIELARRIKANAAAWSAVAGPIIGKRQALEDAVNAARTLKDMLDVVVDFSGAEAA